MSKFILNVIHRPEMVPEYLEKEAAQGKKEDIARQSVIAASLDIFRTQQRLAHENGLKTTIQMTYASLFNQEAVSLAKEHHETYGDEIGLTLLGLPCKEFREKYQTKDFCIWHFSMEDKKAIVQDVFEKFLQVFGFYPVSTGSYYMDAELVCYIKEKYPMVKCAVATCWEEGPKAYRNANNSWYTLNDGGPWSAWIPSRYNIHCPASGPEDDIGIVAIPHLSRDLLAVFDGPGSFFGTHPQNVLRGMVYKDGQYPYLFNLIDQYRALAKYNNGFTYNMVFVGPGWMSKQGRWEAPYSLLEKSYSDCMAYYGDLKKKGQVEDLTMSEFADWYRANKTYTEPTCALWKDILYGSQKQIFWYIDPYLRTCVDMNQGGALVDLRPYAAKLVRPVGIGTKHIWDCSYPFLIQAFYRAGYFTHYAGEGSIKSCKVSYEGEEVDLCLCRTKAKYSQAGKDRILTLDPVEIEFNNLTVKLVSTFTFREDTGEIVIGRKIIETRGRARAGEPGAKVHLNEYITACYGTTEYPEDLSGVILKCFGREEAKELVYQYKCREVIMKDIQRVEAVIPQVNTRLTVSPVARAGPSPAVDGYFREGYAFSPMYTLGITANLCEGEELITCLKVGKAG
ncbi:MAG: hypothetical protein K6U80_03065 [Firmicutes bacterium]|nr:hypothetical protein [Bacillota bacterium]